MNISRLLAETMNDNDYGAITLGQLIETLESADQTLVVADGFTKPDSWRGVYAFLRFGPARNTVVSDMLAHARSAVGATFEGYKGGNYTMNRETPVFIDGYGESNSDTAAITKERLERMLAVTIAETKPPTLPKRPPIVEVHSAAGLNGEWCVVIPDDMWDAFKGYVCKLEAIAAQKDEK
jgi:hypothetical protein